MKTEGTLYIQDEDNGITVASKRFVEKMLPKIGNVHQVYVVWNKQKCRYTTDVIGDYGTLEVTGFGLGYCGEGPAGMAWLLEKVGIKFKDVDVYGEIEKEGSRIFQ